MTPEKQNDLPPTGDPALASASGSNASNPNHTCYLCGHQWWSVDGATAKQVRDAANVNGQGPYCNLCYHLEMASRYADARGYRSFADAIEAWMEAGEKHLNAPDQRPER